MKFFLILFILMIHSYPQNPDPGPEDRKKIIERLQSNFGKTEKRLEENDPRKETQKTQEQIIQDLEKLLKQNTNPNNQQPKGPPPPNNKSKPPIALKQKNEPIREKDLNPHGPKEAKPTQSVSERNFGPEADPKKTTAPNHSKKNTPDQSKGYWADPRKKQLQEADVYSREKALARYENIIRQYYSSISEGRKR